MGARAATASQLWLHRYILLLMAATILMLSVGSLVASGGLERLHRQIGSAVGMMGIGMVIWLWRVERRRWVVWLGMTALALVILQGALGVMSARMALPAGVKIAHACLAQSFFAVAAVLALCTSAGWRQSGERLEDTGWPSLRSLGLAAPLVVLAQAGLGAGYRHGMIGVMPHIFGALAVTGLTLALALILLTQHEAAAVARTGKRLLIVVLHQVPLGVLAYFLRISWSGENPYGVLASGTVAAHVAVGALLMGLSTVAAVQIWRATARETAPQETS